VSPFAIPSIRLENPAAAAHTRISWFRGVSNIPHAFAIQSFVAELAAAVGRDHKDFLLDLLGPPRTIDPAALGDRNNTGEDPKVYPVDIGRWRRVIETAAKEAGWGRTLPQGQGLGIAAHRCELSYAAVVVEAHVGWGHIAYRLSEEIANDWESCTHIRMSNRIHSRCAGW
jgi:isoquinoline 1-oxidoreductase subunit beta